MNAFNLNIQPTFHHGSKELFVLWSWRLLLELEPDLKRPSKKVDFNYKGEYDLYLDWTDEPGNARIIKIEVKASRATDRQRKDEPLFVKSLSSNSNRPFLMNFQQMKPKECDVFIWLAVYMDQIKYWCMNSREVQTNPYLSPHHRHEGTAKRQKNYRKEEIYEGQIMMTNDNISSFEKYLVEGKNLKEAVIAQYKIQHQLT